MELYHSQFTAEEFERTIRKMSIQATEEKDVNFWDYDGTLLYAHTLEEAQALTELPPGPDWHEELVFSKWNWPLDAINALTYQVDVGALYDTDDHATHLHIELTRAEEMSIVANGTGYIDWGDGSPRTELVSAPDSTVSTHAYATPGTYIIRVGSAYNAITLGFRDGSKNCLNGNLLRLRKAFWGSSCFLHQFAFGNCRLLEYATCPGKSIPNKAYQFSRNLVCIHLYNDVPLYGLNGCSSLRLATFSGDYLTAHCIRDCYALRRLRCKQNVHFSETYQCYNNYSMQEASGYLHSGNAYSFYNCYALNKFLMRADSTGLGERVFYNCSSLEELDIRELVTSISAYALSGCTGMRRLRFRPTIPPTVNNANAFTGIPADCIVEVPAASLEAYKNATNYASIAAQMVGRVFDD